jgi:hypothetical protein
MYESDFLNLVLESMSSSTHYDNDKQKIIAMRTFIMMVDKFKWDNYLLDTDISKIDYDKYFKDIVKPLNKPLHRLIKEEFKYKGEY